MEYGPNGVRLDRAGGDKRSPYPIKQCAVDLRVARGLTVLLVLIILYNLRHGLEAIWTINPCVRRQVSR